jgi:maltooligosyltrehalose trehalohydrolase
MIVCLQNHDQIGNRAFGERLHHQIAPEVFRAATAILLFCPETPLLFMGQEWATESPFLYFTDHHPALGALVTAGRRQEFARFTAFTDADSRARIPDPQSRSTYTASVLQWDERTRMPHAAVWRLHRSLLRLRHTEPALRSPGGFDAIAADHDTLILCRTGVHKDRLVLVARLRGAGTLDLRTVPEAARQMPVVLTTEDGPFRASLDEPRGLDVHFADDVATVVFHRPGAVIFRA